MREKLMKIIFGKLSMNLSEVEIIEHNDSIWFIDVDKKCWYLRYKKSDGVLWWRYEFFSNFFPLFSMEQKEYEPIISEWVERILNYKVTTPLCAMTNKLSGVEYMVTRRVNINIPALGDKVCPMDEILNCKISSQRCGAGDHLHMVEDVLNYKVKSIKKSCIVSSQIIEAALNHKLMTIEPIP
jgi:hypothetical protein